MNSNINLATRYYVDYRKLNAVIGALFLVLLVWLLFTIYSVADNYGQISRYSEYKARVAARSGSKVSEADYARFLTSVKNTNAIIYRYSYDWLQLFENLEKLVPEGVTLSGLAPSDRGQTLKIAATARNFSAVRKFVENLEFSKTFTDIYLIDQSNLKEADKLKGINFSVTCKAQSP